MREELQIIINNLKTAFDENPWYGPSMMSKLTEISWQIVNDKTYGSKSIAVLLQHVINWRIFVIKKLEGDEAYDIVIDGENGWDEIKIANSSEWEALKAKIQETQSQLGQILSSKTDALLKQKVPGKNYNFGPILVSITQHDIYHLGQIAMLNAMKKS